MDCEKKLCLGRLGISVTLLSTSLEIVCAILNHQKLHGMVSMVSLLENALSIEMAFPV